MRAMNASLYGHPASQGADFQCKKYLDFILDQLSMLEEISYRAMMGEYILYMLNRNGHTDFTERDDDNRFSTEP